MSRSAAPTSDDERDVLSRALVDPVFVRTALPVLRKYSFTTKINGWIWTTISTAYREFKELPDGRLFRTKILEDWPKKEDQEYVVQALLSIRKLTPATPRSALDLIRSYLRQSSLASTALEVAKGLGEGDPEAAEAALAAGLSEVRSVSLLSEPVVWVDGAPDRLARYMDSSKQLQIRMPLTELNKATNGGMRPGHVMIVAANTNVGKSAFAVDCGYNALIYSKCAVIHVTTEETEDECTARYDARFTGIEKSRFAAGDLTDDEKKRFLDKFARKGKDVRNLLVHELPPGSSVSAIRSIAEQVRENVGLEVPIYVVVDSPDHLKASEKAENYRLDQTGVFWELKALSVDPTLEPIAVVCTVQAKAETAGKKVIRAEDLAETVNKSRIASLIAGLVEGEIVPGHEDDPEKPIEVYISKNRFSSRRKFRIYARANLGTCEFKETFSTE